MTFGAVTGSNPFPGLRPFEDSEGVLFFGRETQVDELLRRLRTQRFIAVVGTSGSGKSSLVRAGLFPALRVGAMSGVGSRWRIATMHPGNDPFGELAAALELAGLLGTQGDRDLRIDLAFAILERGALGLVEIVRQTSIEPDENVLIVVDQFEELFRYAQADENAAAAFVKLLLEATAQPDLRLYVVLTMRSDFLGDCEAFADLPERINNGLYLVSRMTRDQLAQAIVGPVKVAGTEMSPRLVNRLLNDVGEDPDQLPVLAHALMLTYTFWADDHAPGESIDERHYLATGGLTEALDSHAERVYQELTEKRQSIADKVFAAITELGSDNRGIRRPLALSELRDVCDADDADIRAIVEAFRARSCSFLRPPADVPLSEHSIVDISHEALMRGWCRLERLLNQEVESARIYRRLSDAAELYKDGRSALLTDPALSISLAWRDDVKPTMAWADRYGGKFADAIDYLARSAAERARLRVLARTTSRRRWAIALAVIAALVVLTVSSISALVNAQREHASSLVTQSRLLARDADLAAARGDASTAMLYALEALPLNLAHPDRPFTSAAHYALAGAFSNEHEILVLGHDGGTAYYTAAFSANGRRLLTAMAGNTARIYDASSGEVEMVFRGHKGTVYSAVFSPDEKRVVTASFDGTARIWDTLTGQQLFVLQDARHTNPDPYGYRQVYSAAFSPDGQRVVTGSSNNAAQIWNAKDGSLLLEFHGHQNDVTSAVFSPDGSSVLTASADGTARVWSAINGAMLRILHVYRGGTGIANYSADGKRIVTGSNDGIVRVWDAASGRSLLELRGHGNIIDSAEFSHDGKKILTSSDDHTIRVWDAASGFMMLTLGGHEASVSASFSRDASRIASASQDGTARVWSARIEDPAIILGGHRGAVNRVAYSPDGARVVTASDDKTARIWNATNGRAIRVLRGHRARVRSAAFSPDGKRVVTASLDKTARVWDAATGKTKVILHCGGPVFDVQFSPDGKRIVTASRDTTARVWDANNGARLLTLRHGAAVVVAKFSPDGRRIVTGAGDALGRVWSAPTGKLLTVLRGHAYAVKSVAFSPDSNRIATGGGDDVRIWDGATGAMLLVLRQPINGVASAAFSPDGRLVVTGQFQKLSRDDLAVKLWDATSGTFIYSLRSFSSEVMSETFSPDGRHIVAGLSDGTARIWTMPPRCQTLIDEARRRVPRQLSESQRRGEYLEKRSPAPVFLNPFVSGDACK